MSIRSGSVAIRAAAFLNEAGFGSSIAGLKRWPERVRTALRQHEIEAVHWSDLFASDPQRFARMDPLCRVGLMTAELLVRDLDGLSSAALPRVGVVLESAAGCAATDARFLHRARPSLFAYTLPSTLLGEICIRHRFQGPQLCLLTPDGDGRRALEEAEDWLRTGAVDWAMCLCCEAVESSVVGMLGLELAERWGAYAVLLGYDDSETLSKPSADATIRQVCRKLCIDNPDSPFHSSGGSSVSAAS